MPSLSGIIFSKNTISPHGRKIGDGKRNSHWIDRWWTGERDMEFLKDMFHFLMERKKWWLVPVILVLLLIGALLVFAGQSAVAPFIYTLF